jgi:hypothetical protein
MTSEQRVELVKQAQEKAAEWQKSRKKRDRVPEEIWNEAVVLAKKIGINPAGAIFGLRHESLKNKVLVNQLSRDSQIASNGFIELSPLCRPINNPGLEIEISDPSGMRMCIRSPIDNNLNLVKLIEAFKKSP